eukprot:6171394-Pleurochrysis_carterae.AAC.3
MAREGTDRSKSGCSVLSPSRVISDIVDGEKRHPLEEDRLVPTAHSRLSLRTLSRTRRNAESTLGGCRPVLLVKLVLRRKAGEAARLVCPVFLPLCPIAGAAQVRTFFIPARRRAPHRARTCAVAQLEATCMQPLARMQEFARMP